MRMASHRWLASAPSSNLGSVATDFVRLLLACGSSRDLAQGKRIHEQLKQTDSELEHDERIGNILVSMYGKCGSCKDSQRAFNRIHCPSVITYTSLIAAYAAEGLSRECLRVFQEMQLEGVSANSITFISLLKAFGNRSQLYQGKLVHGLVVEGGYDKTDGLLRTTLMSMYVKCGSLEAASQMFEHMEFSHRDTSSWSVMISGYVSNNDPRKALQVFYDMQLEGAKPDKVSFINVTLACSRPEFASDAIRAYACILEHESCREVTVINAVLSMFGKCATLQKTRNIFEKMTERTVASWNTMLGIYIQHGKHLEALVEFRRMLLNGGSFPDKVTFARVFSACGADPETLDTIVSCMVDVGVEPDVVIQTVLVNLYASFGRLVKAREVFDAMQHKDLVLWNVMLGAYANSEELNAVYLLFLRMLHEGRRPDRFSFISVVDIFDAEHPVADQRTKQEFIGWCVKEAGLDSDVFLSNAIITIHGKAGRLAEAEQVFNTQRDAVSWNAMMGALVENGLWRNALSLFRTMQLDGEKPNRISFIWATVAASSIGGEELLEDARKIHSCIAESGFEMASQVGNSVTSMYAKCLSTGDVEKMFQKLGEAQLQDAVSWTALLSAYDERNEPESSTKAVVGFQKMRLDGVVPSKVTLMTMLNIFAREENLVQGQLVHAHVKELGLETDAAVASSLIDMYGECGRHADAVQVFEKVPSYNRDVVVWNAMISACDRSKVTEAVDVLRIFQRMLVEGVQPSRITFAALVESFTELTALSEGRIIHKLVLELGLETDQAVGAVLVNFYGKCGKLDESLKIFRRLGDSVDSFSLWNSLLAAYAQQGHTSSVMSLFHQMLLQGVPPANSTFVGILSSCSHAGKLELACSNFRNMQRDFNVTPGTGEVGCIVDLLGRTGRLEDAEELVRSRISDTEEEVSVMLSALLASCSVHGDSNRGERAAEQLLELEPELPSTYVALSNIRRSFKL